MCRISCDAISLEVVAHPVRPELKSHVIIPAKGFCKRLFAVTVPETLEGHITLELPAFHSNKAIFVANPPPKPDMAEAEREEAVQDEKEDKMQALNAKFQRYFPNLRSYEPMYFSVGTDPEKSKFQLSLRFPFFDLDGPASQRHPWVEGFNFGYTQTCFWDLKSDSKPFEDTSYKPELFFVTPNINLNLPRLFTFRVQTGFQHESNGRGGDDSRSTNYIYAKPIFVFGEEYGYHVGIAPKVWVYVGNDDDTNPDLADYRGYFDLLLKCGKPDSFLLSSNIRQGTEGGSLQMDLTYPLNQLFFRNLNLYAHAQYFTGYAEDLLNYNEKKHAFRLGLALVR